MSMSTRASVCAQIYVISGCDREGCVKNEGLEKLGKGGGRRERGEGKKRGRKKGGEGGGGGGGGD